MNVQELLDFLGAVNPDPEAEVVVLVGGRTHTPTLVYTVGQDLRLEIHEPKSKRKPTPKAKRK